MDATSFVLLAGLAAAPSPHAPPGAPADGRPVLEPRLRAVLDGALPADLVGDGETAEVFAQVLDPIDAAWLLAALGGSIGTASGDVLTARTPLAALDELAASGAFRQIEAGRAVRGRLDEARAYAGVDKVNQGVAPLTRGYTGAGVVIGVADTGLDFAHPAFAGRVGGLWDQAGAWGAGAKGYGATCSATTLSGGSCAHRSDKAHGTHVSSIAAGGAEPYPGVAPGATLLFVNLEGGPPGKSGDEARTTGVCDAVDWMFDQAGDRPAVVNLSLGSHEGPHDGSSLADRCIDGLTGPGRIVVAAAGNEAAGAIHAATGTPTRLHVRGAGQGAVERVHFRVQGGVDAQLDLWFPKDAGAALVVGVGEGDGAARTAAYDGAPDFVETAVAPPDGAEIPVYLSSMEQDDGQRRLEVFILEGAPAEGRWFLEVSADAPWDGFFDVVDGQGFVEGPDALTPDGATTVAFPASAREVIAVGSHRVRSTWPHPDGRDHAGGTGPVGALSAFSGRGPSRNPAVSGFKPDLVAPGEHLIAALSRHATDAPPDAVVDAGPGGFAAFAGTSMASPFAAGVVALMLEAAPALDVAQVRSALRETADTQGISTPLPDPGWGYGRLDAAAAVATVAGGGPPAGGGGDVDAPGDGVDVGDDGEGAAGLCATAPLGRLRLVLAFPRR